MILQELLEASTFRKRSTSQMTYGFEFEVMIDNTEEYEYMIKKLKNEYSFEKYVEETISYFNFKKHKLKYGFASKEDIAKHYSQKKPQEAKLVKEILNLSDNYYKAYYLENLKHIRNDINIDNLSDFDDYLNKNYSSKELNKLLMNINELNPKNFDKLLKNFFEKYFPYDSYFINDYKVSDFIYDKNNNVLNIGNIKLSQIEELFEDSEDIINEFEENYNNRIYNMAEDYIISKDNEKDIKKLLKKSDIKNVDVELDESLGSSGVEIITDKIYGIDEAISQFNKITKFIQNEEKLYTNSRTGLHINIGTWEDTSQLDLTKLLVFSNESQILNKMERQNNRYTRSLVGKLISFLDHKENFQDYNKIIKNINKEILRSANHTSFMDFNKLKDKGYIEIRGFGDKDYEYKSDYIIKMIRYLSRVMEISSNPEEAKQQYIKKLYKVFNLDSELSGEQQQEENFNSILTNSEIDKISNYFPKNNRKIFKNYLKNIDKNQKIILRVVIPTISNYGDKLTNSDMRILYKLLINMDITKDYYEDVIKGESEKIDNLFQNYILKGKA